MDTTQLETKGALLRQESTAVTVETREQYAAAGEWLKGVKAYQREVNDTFGPIIKKAHDAHKEAIKQRDRHLKPAEQAELTVKRLMVSFDNAERRRIAEAQAAREAQAVKEAEDERLAQAAAAEAAGDEQKAEAILEEPLHVAPVPVPAATPAVQGISGRSNWKGEVTDLRQLLAAIAAGAVPLGLVKIDQGALNAHARLVKDTAVVPGVRIWQERSLAVNSK